MRLAVMGLDGLQQSVITGLELRESRLAAGAACSKASLYSAAIWFARAMMSAAYFFFEFSRIFLVIA